MVYYPPKPPPPSEEIPTAPPPPETLTPLPPSTDINIEQWADSLYQALPILYPLPSGQEYSGYTLDKAAGTFTPIITSTQAGYPVTGGPLHTDYEWYGDVKVAPAPEVDIMKFPEYLRQPVPTTVQTGYTKTTTPILPSLDFPYGGTQTTTTESYLSGLVSPFDVTKLLPAEPAPSAVSGYNIFTRGGELTGGIAPVSTGGVSGALGLPGFGSTEPQLALQDATLFQRTSVSPYEGFGTRTFGDLPPTYTDIASLTQSQLNAYKYAFSGTAAGATAPPLPELSISSHMLAATKGGPLADLGVFASGFVGSFESIFRPDVPSVWAVGYEKLGWQEGSYAQKFMADYPGFAAGAAVGEFVQFGLPTGEGLIKGIPKLFSRAEGRLIASMSLKTYPELGLRNMIRTYRENQMIARAIRGMESSTIKVSEHWKPKAVDWLTESEYRGFMEDIGNVPKVQVTKASKVEIPLKTTAQGSRLQTVQLLEQRELLPSRWTRMLTPQQYRRMMMAEDIGLEFYPLPGQVARLTKATGVSDLTKSLTLAYAPIKLSASFFTLQDLMPRTLLKTPIFTMPMPRLVTKTSEWTTAIPKTKELIGTTQIATPKVGMSEWIAPWTAATERTIPGQAMRQAQMLRQFTVSPQKLKYELPRLPRRKEDELVRLARKFGGSYEERINPFNPNFLRDYAKMGKRWR